MTNYARTGTVEATVFQKTFDAPGEYADGFHVVLEDETRGTVRREQIISAELESPSN